MSKGVLLASLRGRTRRGRSVGMHVVDPEDIDGQSASRSHAEALGAALEESGDFQPDDNYEPHHIVPGTIRGQPRRGAFCPTPGSVSMTPRTGLHSPNHSRPGRA